MWNLGHSQGRKEPREEGQSKGTSTHCFIIDSTTGNSSGRESHASIKTGRFTQK